MSGGSMDYLGYKVKDASFREDTPERRALRKHLNKLSKALIAIEWNDSGDGADDESQLIRDALGGAAVLDAAIQHAREAHKELGDELARVEGSWLSQEMRTPAKGFPAIKADWAPKVGEVVWLPSDVQRIYGAEADKGVVLEVLLAGEVCRVAIEHECEEIKIDTKRLRPVE